MLGMEYVNFFLQVDRAAATGAESPILDLIGY
jgi:hypothetical protein